MFHLVLQWYFQDLGCSRNRTEYILKRLSFKTFLLQAQNIKNFKSQRWQMLLNFTSQRRLLLTGTPLQNSLMELWSLMHFLMPNVFQSHRDFKEWFSNPLTGMIEGSQEYNESLVKRLHKVCGLCLLAGTVRVSLDICVKCVCLVCELVQQGSHQTSAQVASFAGLLLFRLWPDFSPGKIRTSLFQLGKVCEWFVLIWQNSYLDYSILVKFTNFLQHSAQQNSRRGRRAGKFS